MASIEDLKEIVGSLMKTDTAALDSSTVLNGLLASSIGRARLDAALRSKLNIANPGVYSVKTFGELCHAAGLGDAGDTQAANAGNKPPLPAANLSRAGVALGVDIQSVAALPEEADYWEGDFYRQHFTRQEIAYALLQPHPRETFAAAWCAKEALRKADARWTAVDWKLIEVIHDADGRPTLRSGEDAIPCAVSLSHTDGFAIAVVAISDTPAPAASVVPVSPSISPAAESPDSKAQWLPLALSIAALLMSLATAAYIALR
jgi:phosphopantetheine--protein transferase-like protein